MHYFTAYGLTIESEFELFGVRGISKPDSIDVTVTRKDLTHPDDNEYDEGRFSRATFHDAFLSWRKVGSIKVTSGNSISVSPREEITTELLSLFITGAAMGILLHQRGYLVLHASAVVLKGKAAAFIGFKGMGKSTTAAAFVGRGHDLVSDDVVAIDSRFYIRPGSDVVKLWPMALESALHDDPETIPRLYPEIEKRARVLDDKVAKDSVELAAIYVLDAGPELAIHDVTSADAFVEVVRHSYAPRFVGTDGTPPEHFGQCTQLVSNIPMFRLFRVADLEQLGDVAEAVENHFSEILSGRHA